MRPTDFLKIIISPSNLLLSHIKGLIVCLIVWFFFVFRCLFFLLFFMFRALCMLCAHFFCCRRLARDHEADGDILATDALELRERKNCRLDIFPLLQLEFYA